MICKTNSIIIITWLWKAYRYSQRFFTRIVIHIIIAWTVCNIFKIAMRKHVNIYIHFTYIWYGSIYLVIAELFNFFTILLDFVHLDDIFFHCHTDKRLLILSNNYDLQMNCRFAQSSSQSSHLQTNFCSI